MVKSAKKLMMPTMSTNFRAGEACLTRCVTAILPLVLLRTRGHQPRWRFRAGTLPEPHPAIAS